MTQATQPTVTVFRRQVIQTGDYEPAEASCSVTLPLNGDESQDNVADIIAQWGTTLDIANYEALGVGYEVDEQGVRMLQKSVSGASKSGAVAPPPPGTPTYAPKGTGGGSLQDVWKDLMENQNDWWPPNWKKKLDPESTFNKNGPDYKRKSDQKGIWLTKKDGTPLVPDWFVCPFTGKDADGLKQVGSEIRG